MTKEAKNERADLRGKTLTIELEEKIERYARVSHYVLITGERGTGKTTLAKNLHEQIGAFVFRFFSHHFSQFETKVGDVPISNRVPQKMNFV